VLYAKDLDQRSITFEKAIAMGEEYQMKSKVSYLRLTHWLVLMIFHVSTEMLHMTGNKEHTHWCI